MKVNLLKFGVKIIVPIQKNIFWFSLGNIVYLGTQWFITILVARSSGLNDAGILSLAISISAVFQMLALFGLRNYQVSDIVGKYRDSLYVQSRLITYFVALFLCVIFIIVNQYVFDQSTAILFYMFFRFSDAFSDVFHGILQKNEHLDLVGKSYFYKGIAIIIFFSIGYYMFKSLNIGLLFMSIGVIFITFFYDMKNAKRVSPFKIKLIFQRECFALLCETAPLCICVCLQSAISTVPKYLLERMCDEVALGAYSTIFAPATIMQMAASYIFTPFIGLFSKYYVNYEVKKFKKLFLQIGLCIISIGAVAVPCAKIVGWKLLTMVFGTVIFGYEYLLIPIMFCTFANAMFAFSSMLSVVIRDFQGQIIACLFGFILCTISSVICISKSGINGASYGLLIGTLFTTLILIARINLKISKFEYRKN